MASRRNGGSRSMRLASPADRYRRPGLGHSKEIGLTGGRWGADAAGNGDWLQILVPVPTCVCAFAPKNSRVEQAVLGLVGALDELQNVTGLALQRTADRRKG